MPIMRVAIAGTIGYEVGHDGSVWSNRSGRWRKLTPQPQSRKDGAKYMTVLLRPTPGAKPKLLFIHRLVLEAFVGPCPEGMEAAHDDGNPTNNHLSNLFWKTPLENKADKKRHGTQTRGETHPTAKRAEADILEMKRLRSLGVTQREIADLFDTSQSYVSQILRGKRWRHLA